jgi:hypothetical protein
MFAKVLLLRKMGVLLPGPRQPEERRATGIFESSARLRSAGTVGRGGDLVQDGFSKTARMVLVAPERRGGPGRVAEAQEQVAVGTAVRGALA